MIQVNVSFRNKNPDTIHNKLKAKIGREPTHSELKAEVARILDESSRDLASSGKLKHQRRR